LAVAEVRRNAARGVRAVCFSEIPTKLGLPSIHTDYWDPVFRAVEETGFVLSMHVGSSSNLIRTSDDMPTLAFMAYSAAANQAGTLLDWLFSGNFDRYPRLKIALSEGSIGWIPYFLERAVYVYAHHKAWTHQDFGSKLPSEVFREHLITCFIDDRIGIEVRHKVGVDIITWECDYPHSDSTWPRAPETLSESLRGVPDEEIDRMTHRNALELFRLDAFRHRPREKCTVGALRAEAADVDLAPHSAGGKPAAAPGEIVRAQHVVSQLAALYATRVE
jgi:predicted TIM-barrel fold metal-dependent hydrolase